MTARWVVDEVRPARDLAITWQPISLFFKNDPDPESSYYRTVKRSHDLLRVMEAVRAAEGDAAVEPLYWEYGRRIHHDQDRHVSAADSLAAVGLDTALAAAADDDSWDTAIRERMDVGLALAGTDIGTPIIAFTDEDGQRVAFFGPVITRVPSHEHSLQLWDGMVAMATVPGFWELKRTRTEHPEFGTRP